MNQKSSSKEEIVEQSLKLLNTLTADSVTRQLYSKEIQTLFELVNYDSTPVIAQSKDEENNIGVHIDKSFPIQWVYKSKKYGFSLYALRKRLQCYVLHIPFTRKWMPQWHDLDCGCLIIARIDNVIGGKDMMHEMRERGFDL